MNINNMKNTLLGVFHISTASMANRLIYFVKRIPLIGKAVPDGIYAQMELKQGLAVVAALFYALYRLFCKALYVGLMVLLPLLLAMEDGFTRAQQGDLFLHIFFFLSCLAGAVQAPKALEAKPNKFICIRLVGMDPEEYTRSMVLFYHGSEFLYFLPSLLIGGIIAGCNAWQLIGLILAFPCYRLMGEALQLIVYRRTKRVLSTSYVLISILLVAGAILAYAPLAAGSAYAVGRWAFFFPAVLAALILGALSLRYILRYPGYRAAAQDVLVHDKISADPQKTAAQNRFRDVKLRDSDFTGEELIAGKHGNQKGYRYLNTIFFERHRRMLVLPLYRRLLIVAVLFVGCGAALLFFPEFRPTFSQVLSRLLPAFCFVMYFASIGERICRAMFYNCDISLLRYSYYRERGAILRNFQIRLARIAGLNLILAAAICLAVGGLIFLSGVTWSPKDMIFFMLCILFLSLFFSVHHLFLYYVCQPYTTELDMKNPLFNIINVVVYMVCYMCLQIHTVPSNFAFIVLGATLSYMVVALALVYKFAPKTFRIK
ncbi:hypothetical protein [Zongyangia hominis]|uniref:Uncharacterized protein n=1 Tax=Zongyangia hominis TaxID=2763677 RepID=A0A926ECX4_9FIRM|nr:hypothetical protein [Zongyangia hominis]MBC8569919.1 hypothetical protein [Zongyangia hominis]